MLFVKRRVSNYGVGGRDCGIELQDKGFIGLWLENSLLMADTGIWLKGDKRIRLENAWSLLFLWQLGYAPLTYKN